MPTNRCEERLLARVIECTPCFNAVDDSDEGVRQVVLAIEGIYMRAGRQGVPCVLATDGGADDPVASWAVAAGLKDGDIACAGGST